MYRNLREYINLLERKGELVRIETQVDNDLEIAEITDRMSKSPNGGKALLFENTASGFPVITNMMGSDRRIAMALGVESTDEISARIRSLLSKLTSHKESFGDKLKMLPLLGEMSRWLPRSKRGYGECQQVALLGDNVDLDLLPILKCWPHDGGRFVTLPLVHTIDPDTGARNVGMYRMQVLSENSTALHWHTHKTGERHYEAYKRRGELMPVSVCLGGDPAYTYAATAPMPDNLDEYLLAGFLRKKPVSLVKCLTNDIYVPTDCDFVIEGYVDPSQEKVTEGPFGDHTGFYSLEDLYPVFHITAITHRKDAIYPATLVGIPPQEDAYIAKATEKIFLEPIRFAMQPEVSDLYMPESGVAHNIAILNIDKRYPGQPFKVANSMWGAGQMMFNKFMVVTSTHRSIRDPETLSELMRAIDISQDTLFSKGVLDVLDHATPTCGYGSKLALDATNERPVRRLHIPEKLRFDSVISAPVTSFARQWSTIILVSDNVHTNESVHSAAKNFVESNGIEGVNFVVIVTPRQAELNGYELLWQVTGNCEPLRDIRVNGNYMTIDARCKISDSKDNPQRWPNVVAADSSTIELVDARWSEYGIGEFIASPSLRYGKLLLSKGARV